MNHAHLRACSEFMPSSHHSSESVASSTVWRHTCSASLSSSSGYRFASSSPVASSRLFRVTSSSLLTSSTFSRVLAPHFSTQPRFRSSFSSVRFVTSSFSPFVVRTLSLLSRLSRVLAPHLHQFQAPPNHAMQLTGSARHGSCSPQTRHGSYRAALRL